MILYHPLDGEVYSKRIDYNVSCAFLMTKLGEEISEDVVDMRRELVTCVRSKKIKLIDADNRVTGRDFFKKIWELIVSVPIGFAIVSKATPPQTLANIYLELGMMQMYGKNVLILKGAGAIVPSDYVRTEHVKYDPQKKAEFRKKIRQFLDESLRLEQHYSAVAREVKKADPQQAADYLFRALLIKPSSSLRRELEKLIPHLDQTTRIQVESLLDTKKS